MIIINFPEWRKPTMAAKSTWGILGHFSTFVTLVTLLPDQLNPPIACQLACFIAITFSIRKRQGHLFGLAPSGANFTVHTAQGMEFEGFVSFFRKKYYEGLENIGYQSLPIF